ncbi:hypothetical protein BDN70DRAFT_879544 [Pholiota conissans]|uniref:Uncharacterized protein n=1 Tax=Pholiota conissans TaxID=109636 RepID=A0A9P5Z120_9AGAR|nr:hypothetical protein BDN70DRAFT_879544 [Pholiota conissans]
MSFASCEQELHAILCHFFEATVSGTVADAFSIKIITARTRLFQTIHALSKDEQDALYEDSKIVQGFIKDWKKFKQGKITEEKLGIICLKRLSKVPPEHPALVNGSRPHRAVLNPSPEPRIVSNTYHPMPDPFSYPTPSPPISTSAYAATKGWAAAAETTTCTNDHLDTLHQLRDHIYHIYSRLDTQTNDLAKRLEYVDTQTKEMALQFGIARTPTETG